MKKVYKLRIIIGIIGFLVVAGVGIGLGVVFLKDDTKSQQPSTILSFSELKDKLEGFSTDPIQHEGDIVAVSDWTDITDSFFTDLVKQPAFTIPSTFDAQYRIPNGLTTNGDLTIELRIRKQDGEWINLKSYIVPVEGIIEGRIKSYLLDTYGKKIIERDSNGVFEVAGQDLAWVGGTYFEGYQGYPPDVSYAQVTGGDPSIDHDGMITVNFDFKINGEFYYVTMDFKVGKDTWAAKEILENLNYGEIQVENRISVTNGWKNLDEFFTTIRKEKPIELPANSDIEYKIDNPASIDEDLVVDFRYRRKDIENDKWTTMTSQYIVPIREINEVGATKTILENLAPLDEQIYSEDINVVADWTAVTDDVYTDILKVEIPNISSNIEVQYQIPNAILHDGDFDILLRYKMKTDDDTKWQTITKTIHVVDLPLHRAKVYINGLRQFTAEYYFNGLDGSLSQFNRPTTVNAENAALIFRFGERERYIDPPEVPIQLIIERDTINDSPQYITLKFRLFYQNDTPVEMVYTLYL